MNRDDYKINDLLRRLIIAIIFNNTSGLLETFIQKIIQFNFD